MKKPLEKITEMLEQLNNGKEVVFKKICSPQIKYSFTKAEEKYCKLTIEVNKKLLREESFYDSRTVEKAFEELKKRGFKCHYS